MEIPEVLTSDILDEYIMDISWVTCTLVFFTIALLAVYVIYMSSEHAVFEKMGIPGPSPALVVGNFFQEIKLGHVKFQQDVYNKYNKSKVYGVYSCKAPILFIRDLDMIRDITVKHFGNFVNRRLLQMNNPLDHMLTMIKDDHWKNVRTTVSPTFSTVKLRRMFQHISSSATTLVEHLRDKQANGEAVELKHVVSCFTMDVIAGTGFGVVINSFKVSSNGSSKRHDFLQLLLEAEKEDGTDNDNMSSDEARELKTAAERKPLTHADIQGQAILFLLAGYDTVSTVFSFTLFLLAQYPECCSRLQAEIDDILGNQVPTYDNIQDMPYMDMCLNETMRLYPPGWMLDRVCNDDINIGGVHIPKGMVVAFPVFSIHRDPAIWRDPMVFDPSRFSPEKKSERHPYAHLPFGQWVYSASCSVDAQAQPINSIENGPGVARQNDTHARQTLESDRRPLETL
ncbi:cytochrome p450 3a11 [Plakobranchus ocellatus]|uniref:Cytochrome p450 3a11 n=1 Tax=Plakobranchus ocellatus TaxID=259542 RepID=A0AAV3YZ93_9GAST|nr:cytochrome p450 3a11 [Plakobranchus ocellatus]